MMESEEETWEILPLEKRGPYSGVFVDHLWQNSHTNQLLNKDGVWEVIPGVYLYAGVTIHGELSICGHHERGFDAPVLWEISFPHQDDRNDTSRVIITNIEGSWFQNDWTKIFLFHG